MPLPSAANAVEEAADANDVEEAADANDVEPEERRARRAAGRRRAESGEKPADWDEETRGENERGCAKSCPPFPAGWFRWEREADDERLEAGVKLGGGVETRRDASAWGIATRRMPPPTPSPVMAMEETGSRFAAAGADDAAAAADAAAAGVAAGRRREPAGMKLGGIA